MSKLIDYVDFLIIALLIALGIYVGWKAFTSLERGAQATTVEIAMAPAPPTATAR